MVQSLNEKFRPWQRLQHRQSARYLQDAGLVNIPLFSLLMFKDLYIDMAFQQGFRYSTFQVHAD